MEKTFEYEFNGYKATVIQPNNPNGKWVWKTEFLYAFDNAEIELLNRGYTRVYYQISNMYGNSKSILLHHLLYHNSESKGKFCFIPRITILTYTHKKKFQ